VRESSDGLRGEPGGHGRQGLDPVALRLLHGPPPPGRRSAQEGVGIKKLEPVQKGLAESGRDQEEGAELDSHEEVRLPFAGPGEIERKEVVLDPHESPGEIKSREMELGSEFGPPFASVVPQQLCYGHCLCDSAPHSS